MLGPDQRVSATAALLDEDPFTAVLEGVQQPHWTGVWRRNPSNYPWPFDVSHQGIDPADWPLPFDPHPEELLAWLVSLNVGLEPGDSGYYDPVSTVVPNPDGDASSIWLLKSNLAEASDRVALPKSNAPTGSGKIAWWVGDEGVKAKVNLADPRATGTDDAALQARQAMPARYGMELLGGLENFPVNDPELPALNQPSRLNTMPTAATLAVENALRTHFHDVSLWPFGLETNTKHGGLKKDLSLAFELPEEAFGIDPFYAAEHFSDKRYPNNTPQLNGLRLQVVLVEDVLVLVRDQQGGGPGIAVEGDVVGHEAVPQAVVRRRPGRLVQLPRYCLRDKEACPDEGFVPPVHDLPSA